MLKKVLIILLAIILLMICVACGIDYVIGPDENLHNKVRAFWGEDTPSYVIYEDEKYLYVGTTSAFRFEALGTAAYMKMVSWNGHRFIGHITEYYSDETINPVFIHGGHYAYLHEGYDYMKDEFVLEGTEEIVVFEDIFGKERLFDENADKPSWWDPGAVDVYLVSKRYPRVKINIFLLRYGTQWYISIPDSGRAWLPSSEFLRILSANGFI